MTSSKKIRPEDARLGMYIESIEGSWLSHPFWKSGFLLQKPRHLAALKNANISAIWIDTDKGVDIEQSLIAEGHERQMPPSDVETHLDSDRIPSRQCSIADELPRASEIVEFSKTVMTGLFREVRLGHAVDPDSCLPVVEQISSSIQRNSAALISLVRLKTKDEYTYMHSVAVCALMIALGRQLGLDEVQTHVAGHAGLLHDIGKMVMPVQVLNKPGRLTDAEYSLMKSHPERGHEILIRSGMALEEVLDVCLHHHEKFDGTGYPHGLEGDQITLLSRMGAVCDVYDAVTSNRPYKQAWDASESLARMAKWVGHFDTAVFNSFVKAVGIYPVGSLVRLESGRLAVVIEQNFANLTRPVLRVFFSTASNAPIPLRVLDLSAPHVNDRVLSREDPAKWGFSKLERFWLQTDHESR